jgi:hypothetical protein
VVELGYLANVDVRVVGIQAQTTEVGWVLIRAQNRKMSM